MKKLLLILTFLVQTLMLAATPNPAPTHRRAIAENVKMYRQPGTSTEVLRSLKSTDEVRVIRKHNNNWSIVTVESQTGYVLTSELTKPRMNQDQARNASGRSR